MRACHLLGLPVLALLIAGTAVAGQASEVIMVLGYDGSRWHPYIAGAQGRPKARDWQRIAVIEDPIAVTRQPGTGHLFVKANNGTVTQYAMDNRHVFSQGSPLGGSDRVNYTHLRAHADGLVAVRLSAGKSQATDIVTFDADRDRVTVLVNQAGVQFHPLRTTQGLFYAHVSCRVTCDPLIQEPWYQDSGSGQRQQLTLLNATSYLHSVDPGGRWAYISSNRSGYYHLGRLDLTTNTVVWLTAGQVTDSYPSIAADGTLYFIRRDLQGTRLMYLPKARSVRPGKQMQPKALSLPVSVKKIRYLEVGRQ